MEGGKKLKNLLEKWPFGTVATTAWFKDLSISTQLVQHYIRDKWIESIGWGAYKRVNDEVKWYGGLSSLQKQVGLPIHVGGPTALFLRGNAHYVRLKSDEVFLFSLVNTRLPKWFLEYDWGLVIEEVKTSMLPEEVAINSLDYKGVGIAVSSLERAILESLYLCPDKFDLLECYQILEGLVNLRPQIVQDLLVQCSSIKVKRLFLYMADKAQLPVFKHLKLGEIDLGSGDRMIVKKGVYDKKYQLCLPKELIDYV
ncbi:MAG: hypothetical protein AUJ82_05555 [Verrucomicrobia bacterium CG1_02_43_26]|nr:MAG: hypothetical protein AUJ82_05555 [Verrucomicrobia bacterium CG1_02_43_26]